MAYFTDEEIHDYVTRSTAAQGLPLKVTDPSMLDMVARELTAARRSSLGRGQRVAPVHGVGELPPARPRA
jgi:hypothetical protein